MRTNPHCDQALRLLGRALATGAVVELVGRALVQVEAKGLVMPGDRSGRWRPFEAPGPGIYACCPMLTGLPSAILSPACYSWLRLGEIEDLPELLPVAEWLAALGRSEVRGFAVGLLHGLGRIAEAGARDPQGARVLIRSPDSLARELFG